MTAARVLLLALGFLLVSGRGRGQDSAPTLQPPSPEQVAQWEAQVRSNGEDETARGVLVNAYLRTGQTDKAMEQMLWIVGHHPEWNAASITRLVREKGGSSFTASDYQQLRAAWEGALADHPNDPEVLYNGATFLQASEGERALQLFRQAWQLQPSNARYIQAIAGMYADAVLRGTPQIVGVPPVNAELAMPLSAELLTLNDAALLSEVGSRVFFLARHEAGNPTRQLGLRLLERATVLEPDNPQWKAALEMATNPPPSPSSTPLGVVRIGSAVAEANLIRKVDPVYPALAKQARISGIVEFTAVIGTDGRIQTLQLVRGHPLLVNAARETVLQYLYKPTLLNGSPVTVATSIVVNFELPPQ